MRYLSILWLTILLAVPAGAQAWSGPGDATEVRVDPDAAYILPDSDVRYYDRDEILGLMPQSSTQAALHFLRLARNEIFARHGFIFRSPELRAYFQAQPWYRPRSRTVALSAVERANVDLLQSIEAGIR